MKAICLSITAVLVLALPCAAGTLKMPEAPKLELEGAVQPLPITVTLQITDELKQAMHVVKTSPFDKMRYPIGEYSVAVLEKNIDQVFHSSANVAATLELKIESFDAVIPSPAYKPYTAEVVYRASVTDSEGNTIFTVVTTGSAQTSKGMMSGFKAKRLAAESAAQAMNDAMTQILEALVTSEELVNLASPPEDITTSS